MKTILSHILSEKNFRKVEKYRATKSVTVDDVTSFARRFWLEMTSECFFYGDVDVEKAEVNIPPSFYQKKQLLSNLFYRRNKQVGHGLPGKWQIDR